MSNVLDRVEKEAKMVGSHRAQVALTWLRTEEDLSSDEGSQLTDLIAESTGLSGSELSDLLASGTIDENGKAA